MKPPRGLTAEEAAAWAEVAASVRPIDPARMPPRPVSAAPQPAAPPPPPAQQRAASTRSARPAAASQAPPARQHLDATWDRKLGRGTLQPDLTLDLHGHTLDTAYTRLMDGLDQARAMGARVVLLIAGRPRPAAAADRADARGAIRAKVLDWLAASRHHAAIAAVRKAHIRHGGEGALYIVLRKPR